MDLKPFLTWFGNDSFLNFSRIYDSSIMIYRELNLSDFDQFVALRKEALVSYPESFSASEQEEVTSRKDFFETALQHSLHFIFGAFEGEKLLGMAIFLREKKFKIRHKGEIVSTYVKQEYHGQRIGLNLMKHVLEKAFQQPGLQQINLVVNSQRPSAIALYKKLGFVQYGLEINAICVEGKMYDAIHMVKKNL